MKNVDAVFAGNKYSEISKLGTRYNLSFSSQLILSRRIIALDGIKRLLLVVDTDSEQQQPSIIDLHNVATVTVRRSYGRIDQGELRTKSLEAFLKGIDLQFKLKDNTGTIVLPFYDSEADSKRERSRLSKSANNWQLILSKMIGT